MHHLEGERAGCPRAGWDHISEDKGQKATEGDQGWPAGQVVWKRRGGLETIAQVRHGSIFTPCATFHGV